MSKQAFDASLKVDKYILSIRNERKRQFAAGYYGFKVGLLNHAPQTDGLTLMAAQAVRMNIEDILAARAAS